jgi:hypothetical protein
MNPSQITELQEKVADLQNKLLSQHPLIPTVLRSIHTQLRADPENVTLLSEEEIGVIVNGLKLQTNTEIATTVAKTTSTKSLAKQIKSAGGSAVDLF